MLDRLIPVCGVSTDCLDLKEPCKVDDEAADQNNKDVFKDSLVDVLRFGILFVGQRVTNSAISSIESKKFSKTSCSVKNLS